MSYRIDNAIKVAITITKLLLWGNRNWIVNMLVTATANLQGAAQIRIDRKYHKSEWIRRLLHVCWVHPTIFSIFNGKHNKKWKILPDVFTQHANLRIYFWLRRQYRGLILTVKNNFNFRIKWKNLKSYFHHSRIVYILSLRKRIELEFMCIFKKSHRYTSSF